MAREPRPSARLSTADPVDLPRRLRLGGERRGEEAEGAQNERSSSHVPHRSTPPSSASAFSSQNVMSISRYIVVGGGQVLVGLRAVPGAAVELAEAEVAVGDEGAHAELVGARRAPAGSALRRSPGPGGSPLRGDLAEEAERPGLVAALLLPRAQARAARRATRERARPRRPARR